MSKEPVCNKGDARSAGDAASVPGSGGSPGGGKLQLILVFLPEKSHGQRSLASCSTKSHKESDMTEQLSMHAQPSNKCPTAFRSQLWTIHCTLGQ